ncbi:hypothetical protein ACFPYJ_16350 [Paenibacillus solisilvae]|uniref:Uncharacterized protein n=1 Tax=Paenibacillus solisilvae TaxID=2486751 RepID=A0ABW0VXQ6_9BACL
MNTRIFNTPRERLFEAWTYAPDGNEQNFDRLEANLAKIEGKNEGLPSGSFFFCENLKSQVHNRLILT